MKTKLELCLLIVTGVVLMVSIVLNIAIGLILPTHWKNENFTCCMDTEPTMLLLLCGCIFQNGTLPMNCTTSTTTAAATTTTQAPQAQKSGDKQSINAVNRISKNYGMPGRSFRKLERPTNVQSHVVWLSARAYSDSSEMMFLCTGIILGAETILVGMLIFFCYRHGPSRVNDCNCLSILSSPLVSCFFLFIYLGHLPPHPSPASHLSCSSCRYGFWSLTIQVSTYLVGTEH